MKFAIAAIIATTAAIQIRAPDSGKEVCVSKRLAAEGFKALDTDDSGSLSYDEVQVGLEELAKSLDYTPTDADWAWIQATGEKIDSATPGKVDHKEFFKFANAVAKHWDICHLAREAEKDMPKPRMCVSKDLSS